MFDIQVSVPVYTETSVYGILGQITEMISMASSVASFFFFLDDLKMFMICKCSVADSTFELMKGVLLNGVSLVHSLPVSFFHSPPYLFLDLIDLSELPSIKLSLNYKAVSVPLKF